MHIKKAHKADINGKTITLFRIPVLVLPNEPSLI